MKRVFLIVLDSVGIGEMPDAKEYGDEGSNTVRAASYSPFFSMPNMAQLGCFLIDGVEVREGSVPKIESPTGSFARLAERSRGKDTTTGHWEIAGLISKRPLPTYPQGFPSEVIEEFERRTGKQVLCNRPYSGTEVIRDYGKEQMETGGLIVYTSADSVFQIAAHEDIIPVEELYHDCEIARELLVGEYAVGRVIARPFAGSPEEGFVRTTRRHDYSMTPPGRTMLNQLEDHGFKTIGVGKINDIFAGSGIGEFVRTTGNLDGMKKTLQYQKKEFEGLVFVNLVDFDMLYGHRNDVDGYAKALTEFDQWLPDFLAGMKEEDLLMITADHGCDPSTPSTDHSREYVPLIMKGKGIRPGKNYGTRESFADIAATIQAYFGLEVVTAGHSLMNETISN